MHRSLMPFRLVPRVPRGWTTILATVLLVTALPAQRTPFVSPLALRSDDARLVAAFTWARGQASAFAFDGDAVGPWFEAAMPGREAFCMRDVAHQVMGAHALGMQRHVRNMLQHFASEIRESRDWASLWEIDRHGRPAHADYRNDRDFWYNLPANFDILDATWRMYLWSGDPAYLHDPDFTTFSERTVTSYVDRWAIGVDSIMRRTRIMHGDRLPEADAKFTGARGIPGYNEEGDDFVAGLDLLAAEYAGFAAHARLLEARGDLAAARIWLRKAAAVKQHVNTVWWDDAAQSFHDYLSTAHVLRHRTADAWNSAALYWPVATDGAHTRATVQALVTQIRRSRSAPIEEQSHHPEVLYRHGAAEVAYDQIMDLTRVDRERREYPEVSFSVIGAIVTGLMGVSVDPVVPGREAELLPYFAGAALGTMSQLTAASAWVELAHLPVRGNMVTVRHDGHAASEMLNESGPALVWQAAIPGAHSHLFVNGVRTRAATQTLSLGREVSTVRVVVAPGVRIRVSLAR